MLTCTVSMVETCIAIIATCLPALRSMILGKGTTKGTSNSYGKHYELSSARRKTTENRLTASYNAGVHSTHDHRSRANGSEDSLVSDGLLVDVNKITVNTQIQTMFEDSRNNSAGSGKKSPF
jgi:hypothetical protein